MLSTFGGLVASLFASPRIFFALAADGLFFKSVAKVHPKFHTPHVAIGINIVLAVVFVLIRVVYPMFVVGQIFSFGSFLMQALIGAAIGLVTGGITLAVTMRKK